MEIVINGYYGVNNLGDDYILYSILGALSKVNNIDNYEIKVFSSGSDLSNVFTLYPNLHIRCIKKKNEKFIVTLMKERKGFLYILGGGGLFPNDDYKQYLHCAIYLTAIRIIKGGQSIIYGVDICDVENKKSKLMWKIIQRNVEKIMLRNKYSRDLLEHSVGLTKVDNYADVTFGSLTIYEKDSQLLDNLEKKLGIAGKRYIIWALAMPWNDNELSTRHYQTRYQKLVDQYIQLANKYSRLGYHHLFIPFFHIRDRILIEDVTKRIEGNFTICEEYDAPLEGKRALFMNSVAVISMRFHGVAFAIKHAIPVVALSYAQKTTELMRECGLQDYCLQYGIRNSSTFKREFDFDTKELDSVVEKAILYGEKNRFLIAAEKMERLALNGEKALIEVIEDMGK